MTVVRTPKRKLLPRLLIVLLLFACPAPVAFGQIAENVFPEQLEEWRRATGDVIRVCYLEESETPDFDMAVGETLADRLLLDVELVPMAGGYGIDAQFFYEDLYVRLTNDCDVAIGLTIGAGIYPTEFTVTRPYVNIGYVLGVIDPDYQGLLDIPRDRAIGTHLATRGEVRLVSYMNTLPREQQWLRLPYADPNLMLTRLLDGTIAGMVLYAPTLADLKRERPEAAEVRALSLDPVRGTDINIGGVLIADNLFLRTLLDQAIDDIVADGTIVELLQQNGLGEMPAVPGAR